MNFCAISAFYLAVHFLIIETPVVFFIVSIGHVTRRIIIGLKIHDRLAIAAFIWNARNLGLRMCENCAIEVCG